MLPDFKKIIEVFECMSLDNNAYFTFQNLDDIQVCVQYENKISKKDWSIWFAAHESQSKQTLSSNHLLPTINAFKIREDDFIKEIASILLFQAAFADEFIREITIILGKEAVQKSIFETQSFMEELGRSVKQSSTQNTDTAIKSQSNRKGLRIIK